MLIQLFQNMSDKNVVFKSLSGELAFNCVLKDVTSVTSPQITITTDTDLSDYNYAYIPEFSRYYYIQDMSSVNYGLWRLNMSVDVLMSYSHCISFFEAIISRAEDSNETSFLRDTEATEYMFKDVTTTIFPHTPLQKSVTTYLLTTLGKGGEY